jgi:hypothetical protein
MSSITQSAAVEQSAADRRNARHGPSIKQPSGEVMTQTSPAARWGLFTSASASTDHCPS